MSESSIIVEKISKEYQLGLVGAGDLRTSISQGVKKILSKKVGKKPPFLALDEISMNVKKGEVVGIVGRNGAGKSTLLKVLSKITQPSSGRIIINGRIASLLEVGTGFHPELTGRENIFLNGSILGMRRTEIREKFDEIVAFSGVEKFLETPVKRYSSGMYVRLAFAVAAHLEPEILVIDEVLAVGDAEFQKKCLGKMNDVAKQGRTVLFVSHNMMAVKQLCNRAILLQHGRIHFKGSTEKTVNTYLRLNQSNAQIQIKDRNDRSGNQQLRFVDYHLLNREGTEIQRFTSGSFSQIAIVFDTLEPIKEAIFRIKVYSQNGQLLFICNNYHTGDSLGFVKGKNQQVVCTIDKLPLNPGIYHFDLACYSMGVQLDDLEFAGEIEVESGDYFGSGQLPAITDGVLINNKWEHQRVLS